MKSPLFSSAWREECCAWTCVVSAGLCFFLALFILPVPPFREECIHRLRYAFFMGDMFFEIFGCALFFAAFFSLVAALHKTDLRFLVVLGVCILWIFMAGRLYFGRFFIEDTVAGAVFPPLDDRLVYTMLSFWVVHTALVPALLIKIIPSLKIRDDALCSGYRLFLLLLSAFFFLTLILRPHVSFVAVIEYSAAVPVSVFVILYALSAGAVMIRRILT